MDLFKAPHIKLGLSRRLDGSMKDQPLNRHLFLQKQKLDSKIILAPELVHGNKIVSTHKLQRTQTLLGCDALITNNPKQVLTITVADCLPVYFYDSKNKVIALAHAGWRGLIDNILVNVINSFNNDYQSAPENIYVFIGPHIKTCHFEVKTDVANLFPSSIQTKQQKKIYLDLGLFAKLQLLDLGVLPANIEVSPECTYCLSNKYFSYRRDKAQGLKTMLAYIGLDNKN